VKLIVLGSGTSTGVPRIGNDWGECDPNEPKNRRSRVSIVVQSNAGGRILVDTSTDLRNQLLATGIAAVDAVVWTHDHADHCHGIDDLRPMRFGRNAPLPGYASDFTVRRLKQRFSYVFAGKYGYVMNGGTSASALSVYELQAKEFTGYWSGQEDLDTALKNTTAGMEKLLK